MQTLGGLFARHIALVDNIAVTVPINESPVNIAAAKNAFHTCGQNGGIIIP